MAQASSVARFQGLGEQYIFLRGQDFCFYYIFKINLSGNNKIWRAQKNLGALPWNAPSGYGPGLHHRFGSRLKFPDVESHHFC